MNINLIFYEVLIFFKSLLEKNGFNEEEKIQIISLIKGSRGLLNRVRKR
jgi:hypothetical protein